MKYIFCMIVIFIQSLLVTNSLLQVHIAELIEFRHLMQCMVKLRNKLLPLGDCVKYINNSFS